MPTANYQIRPFEDFEEFIRNQGFFFDKDVLYTIYTEITVPSNSVKAFLLRGPAGTGKTSLAELVAKYLDAELVLYQCTYGTSEDDLLYKYVPDDTTKSGIRVTLGPIPLALKKSLSRKVVLLVDEFDKTRPSTDAMLLDVLQNARVSLYINNEESIVKGNKDNLIVFITSNDFREFSEPLLRRVVQIHLKPLPSAKVYEILSKELPEKIAVLLTQLYDDTIKAGLRKPATIQELLQLGRILQSNPPVEFSTLVRAYVVKYDDDWQKYIGYINSREPYQWVNEEDDEDDSSDIVEAYEASEEEIEVTETQEETANDVKRMPERIPKLRRKFMERSIETEELMEFEEEVVEDGSIIPADIEHYTAVVKLFKPEPSDRPEFLDGIAEFRRGYAKMKALSYNDLLKLAGKPEADTLFKNSQILITFKADKIQYDVVEIFNKILYYSRSLIRGKVEREDRYRPCSINADIAIINESTIEMIVTTKCEDPNAEIWYVVRNLIDKILSYQRSLKGIKHVTEKYEELVDETRKRLHDLFKPYIKDGWGDWYHRIDYENVPPEITARARRILEEFIDKHDELVAEFTAEARKVLPRIDSTKTYELKGYRIRYVCEELAKIEGLADLCQKIVEKTKDEIEVKA